MDLTCGETRQAWSEIPGALESENSTRIVSEAVYHE